MTLDLPQGLLTFYCPLAGPVSGEADALRKRTLAWAHRFDLGEGDDQRAALFAQTGATMAAYLSPLAKGDVAQAFSDYNAWAWAANDRSGSAEHGENQARSPRRWCHHQAMVG
ncbi:hypothetical protein [Nocardia sp. NPDC052566]|uniref:hypothetical protein n=1 Tax=Nocardia sp. NPDC052566 TaxID=3364330 RepID=UPI0037C7268B